MATFLSDTFTDTNTTLLQDHTGETGATWAKNGGTASAVFTIYNNRIYCGNATTWYYASGTPASADYEVTATIRIVSAANNTVGVIGRQVTSAATGYTAMLTRVSTGGGTWTVNLYRHLSGSSTLGTYTISSPPSAGTKTDSASDATAAPAADEEHRRRSCVRQRLHQPGRRAQDQALVDRDHPLVRPRRLTRTTQRTGDEAFRRAVHQHQAGAIAAKGR